MDYVAADNLILTPIITNTLIAHRRPTQCEVLIIACMLYAIWAAYKPNGDMAPRLDEGPDTGQWSLIEDPNIRRWYLSNYDRLLPPLNIVGLSIIFDWSRLPAFFFNGMENVPAGVAGTQLTYFSRGLNFPFAINIKSVGYTTRRQLRDAGPLNFLT